MNRILVLGDIHGKTIWKDIIEKENLDQVIFLGDYVTTHESISPEQQLFNLENILSYKESNLDKVILLRGNHDCCELGYYWAECYPNEPKVREVMSKSLLKERFENLTQWIYIKDNVIFSHAGVSEVWLHDIAKLDSVEEINNLGFCEAFGFTPDSLFDNSGYSKTQPPTWIRPYTLQQCNILGYDQVVGHTPVEKGIINIKQATKGNQSIWLCDALDKKQYLLIDDNMFIIKTLEK